jgi:glutaminyl-peptide cyclotransferase
MSHLNGAEPDAIGGGWRVNAAIVCGTAIPVLLLALMSWIRPDPEGMSPTMTSAPPLKPRRLQVEVLAAYPHDTTASTQGLLFDHGVLYESTGVQGRSTIRRVDVTTGKVLQSVPLAADQFGEGIARTPQGLFQLTYKNQIAMLYDPASLTVQRTFKYDGEGWGLCFDGTSLVMSNGTSTLTFRSPETFEVVRRITVIHEARRLVPNINELECVDGAVYANIWRLDLLARIEPSTGRVLDRIDASVLLTDAEREKAGVLNGIAYDPAEKVFYLTGKNWPWVYKVRFVPEQKSAPPGP